MYSYSNSSNALKLNYSELSHYNTVRKTPIVKENKTLVKAKTNAKSKVAFSFTAKSFFMVAAAFVIAFFMVRGYIAINEAENNITSLKNELRMIQSENQAIKAKIDKSIDLKNLQLVANEKFGMVRPENYQVFYMDLDFDDYTESADNKDYKKEKKEIPVESVTGVLISSADMFR